MVSFIAFIMKSIHPFPLEIRTSFVLFLLIATIFSGCSTTKSSNSVRPSENTSVDLSEEKPSATEDWHLLTADPSHYYGTGVSQAYSTILADKAPKKEVVVAIIDSGTDIEHADLAANIWINKDEIAGNDLDEDGNGYIDDIHGWNFIGGPDGRSVAEDTYEVTRLYVKMGEQFKGIHPDSINENQLAEYQYFQRVKKEYEAKANETKQAYLNYAGFYGAIQDAKTIFGIEDLLTIPAEQLLPKQTDPQPIAQAKRVAGIMIENELSEEDVKEALEHFENLAKYGINPEFDPREIVGDNYEDLSNRFYGNNDVAGVHNNHGTHVAGIVGAIRNNELGMDGIAAAVKLMIIRVVPDGDERDKDVANGIRYAAENGADIINMSFGKGFSPEKEYVDSAVRFADSLGVLMIHAAGNDGENIDTTHNFPTRYYLDGNEADNWMNVGASSWKNAADLPATFSNYGKTNVELFAPGVDIYSTVPDNKYEANNGTSMASPVVAGVAALVMSYYPELSANEVKQILINSVTVPKSGTVVRPGNSEGIVEVPFSSLSITGGIVNAYNALKLAELQVNSK